MTTLVYLEAALNADGAEQIQESNKEVLNYALQVVDTLVQDEHEFTEGHLGQFIVHEDIEETYDSIQNPSGDVVIESIDMFSHVISDETTSIDEKKDLIECGALAISVEADPMTILAEGLESSARHVAVFVMDMVDKFKDYLGFGHWYDISVPMRHIESSFKDVESTFVSAGSEASKGIASYYDSLASTIGDGISAVSSAGAEAESFVQARWAQSLAGDWGKYLDKLPTGTPDWLVNAANNYLKMVDNALKQTTGAQNEGTVVVVGLALLGLGLLAMIALAVALWKSGGKKQSANIFAQVRKALTGIKGMKKSAKKK